MNKRILRQRSEALLIAMVGSNLAVKWWNTPNKAFDLKTPEYIWGDQHEKVYSYLIRCAEGDW